MSVNALRPALKPRGLVPHGFAEGKLQFAAASCHFFFEGEGARAKCSLEPSKHVVASLFDQAADFERQSLSFAIPFSPPSAISAFSASAGMPWRCCQF